MSRVDDELRRSLRRLERPVRTDVFVGVEDRKRRRRTVHRLGMAGIAAIVVVSTLAGGYGLLRVFAPGEGTLPGDGGQGVPSPLQTERPTEMCERSSVEAIDLNGDGMGDAVEVYADPAGPGLPCAAGDPGPYHAHVELTTAPGVGIGFTQALPECQMPYGCRVFAAPDLDGDRAHEVAIQLGFGASTTSYALYRFDLDAAPDGGALARLTLAEPGDPWDLAYGLPAGPLTLSWYGSVTHQQWLTCSENGPRLPTVINALRSEEDPGVYHVHGTVLRLVGVELRPVSTWDDEMAERRLEVPATMCGAELIPPVEN